MAPMNAMKIQEALTVTSTLPVILHGRMKDLGEHRIVPCGLSRKNTASIALDANAESTQSLQDQT
jgi:hypothetical protein